jgi:hypothetical protein
MSLALIQESAKEVRRLAIAGSPLAVGDFRLKKLAAPLEQAGAKVPVFAQVAKAINDVVNGKEADSAANLLNLSTLLNAILYTQGQSSAEGEIRELETFASNSASTRTPARLLKPLVQALTSTGSGRFETVKSAVERGAFNDLRLIDPAIQALGDVYPELADLVAEKILPGYGPGIVPLLKSGLDLKGKKADARRLQIMHELDPEETLPLCKTTLEDGSPEVKVAAITCLGKHEDCLPLVLEQANAKNKQLRAAALEALAEHDRPDVTKLFIELVKGKALDVLAGPFRTLRNKQVLNSLLDEGKRVFGLLVKGESEQIPRFWEVLDCLVYHKDASVEEFTLGCFSQSDKIGKLKGTTNSHVAGDDVVIRLTGLLYGVGTPKTLEAILAKRDTLPTAVFGIVLRSALCTWPAEKVFTEFSPLLSQTKGAGKEKCVELERFISTLTWDMFSHLRDNFSIGAIGYHDLNPASEQALKKAVWDMRWLDAAVKADQPTIVCSLARPNHKAALNYLLKMGEAKKTADAGLRIRALMRCGYPKTTEFFLKLVAKKAKASKHLDYELQFLLENARYLPAADLPKLDEFAATLDEKFTDAFLEALAPLRTTTQPTEA